MKVKQLLNVVLAGSFFAGMAAHADVYVSTGDGKQPEPTLTAKSPVEPCLYASVKLQPGDVLMLESGQRLVCANGDQGSIFYSVMTPSSDVFSVIQLRTTEQLLEIKNLQLQQLQTQLDSLKALKNIEAQKKL